MLKARNQELERRIQELSCKLLEAHEGECNRIGQELHDGLAQSLSAIKIWIESALMHIERKEFAEATRSLKTAIPLAQSSIDEIRRISRDLRPAMLDDLGILASVSFLCNNFKTLHAHIDLITSVDIDEADVPESLKLVIFRVLQEALNNIARHSRADAVCISLTKTEGTLRLCIKDNGNGFDIEKAMSGTAFDKGLGLNGMRERVTLSRGFFSIESDERKGTSVRASWEC